MKMLISPTGCKVESIFLNVEAVNTHRDKPQVSLLTEYEFKTLQEAWKKY